MAAGMYSPLGSVFDLCSTGVWCLYVRAYHKIQSFLQKKKNISEILFNYQTFGHFIVFIFIARRNTNLPSTGNYLIKFS